MKHLSRFVAGACVLALAAGCGPQKGKEDQTDSLQLYTGPPYSIQVEEFSNPALPDLHSYTHAIYKDKIIMFGGRTNGLHANSYNFSQANSNTSIYVVDTKNWSSPDAWQVSSMPDSKIALDIASGFKNKDQFRANNAEFFTEGDVLYVVGGLLGSAKPTKLKDPANPQGGLEVVKGAKALQGVTNPTPITLPYLTAITLPDLVQAVTGGKPMPKGSIRQVQNSQFALTGGELGVLGNTVYLVFGWDFSFANPGDLYSHKVQSFTYTDDGKTLSATFNSLCATCWDGQPDSSNTGNYRRRDGSLSAMIDPADSSEALLYYSGVFKNGNTNFDTPVWIGSAAAAEQPFTMRSNVYTCQVVPTYSRSRRMAYATLLGGMTNAKYIGGPIQSPVLLNDMNAPLTPPDTTTFTSVPFSNQFTTMQVDMNHQITQHLLPDSFPKTMTAITLADSTVVPAGTATYNGSESELFWVVNAAYLLPNGVVDYDAFVKANPGGGMVAYLHGGIQSLLPNVFGAKAAKASFASNRIFAVKIVPLGN